MATNRRLAGAALAVALAMLLAPQAAALSLVDTNLVDLVRDSRDIVIGDVTSVTDGIDGNGVPYTEVTLEVSESIRGDLSGTYTFRQFGLLAPRPTADGTKLRMDVTPAGFPRFQADEQVVLFLYNPAAWTGLRTTVGLAQGKFVLGAGRAESGLANEGLFHSVSLDEGLASDLDRRMLDTEIGAVSSETFVSFVRRAVQNSWVETCRMWDTEVGKTCRGGVKRPTRSTPRTTINTGSTPSGSQTFGRK